MNYKTAAEQIFLAAVDRVLPGKLIAKAMSLKDNCLSVKEFRFNLDSVGKLYVIGAGKASAMMGEDVERILGDRIAQGHIVVKYGHAFPLNRIEVTEAGHPVPDSNGFMATGAILELARKAETNDIVICLLSGGGSALLTDFPEGSSQEEIRVVNNLLVNCGASISEINTVRKHLSCVKGGQLAKAVFPGQMINLILSDVIGDPLDVIASGPTVPDPSTFKQALDILRKYNLSGIPEKIFSYLIEGEAGHKPETPKAGEKIFERTFNILIGNNRLALEAAEAKANSLRMKTVIITDRIEGEITDVSGYIISRAFEFQHNSQIPKPVCLLFGGEPTVKVNGKGTGGRNQHLALYCSGLLRNHKGITILSAGTDGNDGPTSAAGAVVDCNTFDDAVSRNIIPEEYLSNFDSYNFFTKAGGHIITGPTMTNVMDIIVVLIS